MIVRLKYRRDIAQGGFIGGGSSSASTSTTNELAATASGTGVALTGQGSQNVSAGIGQQTGANYQETGSTSVSGASQVGNSTISGTNVTVNDPNALLELANGYNQTISNVAASGGNAAATVASALGSFAPTIAGNQNQTGTRGGGGGGGMRWLQNPMLWAFALLGLLLWRTKKS